MQCGRVGGKRQEKKGNENIQQRSFPRFINKYYMNFMPDYYGLALKGLLTVHMIKICFPACGVVGEWRDIWEVGFVGSRPLGIMPLSGIWDPYPTESFFSHFLNDMKWELYFTTCFPPWRSSCQVPKLRGQSNMIWSYKVKTSFPSFKVDFFSDILSHTES